MSILIRNDYKYVHTLEDIGLKLGDIIGKKYIIGYEKAEDSIYVAYVNTNKTSMFKREDETNNEYYDRLNESMSDIIQDIHETNINNDTNIQFFIEERKRSFTFEDLLI